MFVFNVCSLTFKTENNRVDGAPSSLSWLRLLHTGFTENETNLAPGVCDRGFEYGVSMVLYWQFSRRRHLITSTRIHFTFFFLIQILYSQCRAKNNSSNQHAPGAPSDSFLSDPLKRYFRLCGEPFKLCRFISGRAIIFLSVRSF